MFEVLVKAVDFVHLWGVKICTGGRYGRGGCHSGFLCVLGYFSVTKVASLIAVVHVFVNKMEQRSSDMAAVEFVCHQATVA
jgi:hypothetical protein